MEIGKVDAYRQWAVATAPVPLSPKERSQQDNLIKAVHSINQNKLAGENREMTYSLDPATHRVVFKLIDTSTKEVIRQIPPEYLLRLAEETSSKK